MYSTIIPCQFAGGVDGVGDGHAVEAGGDANNDQQLHLACSAQMRSRVIAHAHINAESTVN